MKDANALESQLKEQPDPVLRTQILDARHTVVIEPYIFKAVILLALGLWCVLPTFLKFIQKQKMNRLTQQRREKQCICFSQPGIGSYCPVFLCRRRSNAGDSIIRYDNLWDPMTSAKYFTSLTL